MTDRTQIITQPGEWQVEMVRRVMALGYAGFVFGPGNNWWPIDHNQKKIAGPFTSTGEFDTWLTEQEQAGLKYD